MTTEEKRLKERGKRLWKNYRWTNEMYDELFRLQNGKCAICGKLPKKAPLNVDHIHFKIITTRISEQLCDSLQICRTWSAVTVIGYQIFKDNGHTKKEAVENLKNRALPYSVRGLLCPGRHGKAGHGCCNRLIGRIDNIPWLNQVVRYLENPPAKKILDNPT